MGSEDMRRQRPNVERMELLGAEVRPVEFGTRTLKEATSEAIRDWITNVETTHYLIGSCVGPCALPRARARAAGGDRTRGTRAAARGRGPPAGDRARMPSAAARTRSACSRASSTTTSRSSASRRPAPPRSAAGDPPCCTARARRSWPTRTARSPTRTRSPPVSTTPASGRNTPGCGTTAARATSRATDEEALDAFRRLTRTEGIIPALEPAHALARVGDFDARARARLPLRSRRQGPGGGARRADEDARRLPHVGAGDARARRGGGRGRRRRGRARLSLLRPARRRPRDPRARPSGRWRVGCARAPASTASPRSRDRVDVPLVPMTYASLLEAYGWERFAQDARAAGASSLIVADLPAGERPELRRDPARRADVDRRAARARRARDRRLALPRHADRDDRRPRRALDRTCRARRARPGASPTCRSTRASGSRRPSTRAQPPTSPTASSSAPAPCRRPRKARPRCATTCARCATALDAG